METQPLLRSANAKSQAVPAKAAPGPDDDKFGQQLQKQMQPAERGEASAKAKAAPVKADGGKAEPVSAEHEVAQTDPVEENAEDVAVPLDLIASVINGIAGSHSGVTSAEAVETPQQNLPEAGNELPLNLLMPLVVDEVQVVVDAATAALETATAKSVAAAVLLAKEPMADELLPGKLSSTALDLSAELALASSLNQLQKSPDVISDKQVAAMLQDSARATVVSLQQVQVITGSAAAHVQPYVPPQFDAGLTAAFNGSVHAAVTHPTWANRIGEQLAFMIQGKFHSAEIKLNPAHLGPLEIQVTVQDDQASVRFVSAHAAVRDALDAALPRLRDMLDQQGLNLLNVDVSAHSGSQREAFKAQDFNGNAATAEEANETVKVTTVVNARLDSGVSIFV